MSKRPCRQGTVVVNVWVEDGVFVGTNDSLNYSVVAPTWDDLVRQVAESGGVEGWEKWAVVSIPPVPNDQEQAR